MLKIGDFSKLSLVSVKTLRYYDEIGLLKPFQVDSFTGYRYYSVDQLPRLNRILTLKDLGFSLEHVAQLLDEGLSPAQLRGMLRLRQVEIKNHLDEEQRRLARVEARLMQIEQENRMSNYDILIKDIAPQTVASLRQIISVPQDVGKLFERLHAYLGQHGVDPGGPSCAIWHDAEHKENKIDVEVAISIASALPGNGGIQSSQLPGVKDMATTIHQGSYEGFPQAYAAILAWLEANEYKIAGPTREIYLRGPGPEPIDPNTYVTEIQVPIEKV